MAAEMAEQQEQISLQNLSQAFPISVEPRSQDSDRPSNPNLPSFLSSVRLKYVKLGYHLISKAMYLLLVLLLGISSAHMSTLTARDLAQLSDQLRFNLVTVVLFPAVTVLLVTLYFMTRPSKVYLVDFACYKPNPAQICTSETFMERSELTTAFTEENLAFQQKILDGLSESWIRGSTEIGKAWLRFCRLICSCCSAISAAISAQKTRFLQLRRFLVRLLQRRS